MPGSPTIYYYAKRGCAKWTEITETKPATNLPLGYANVNQQTERSLTPKSNTLKASGVNIATTFECFMCQAVMEINTTEDVEPIYRDFDNQDVENCWHTGKTSTATSGLCETKCFTTAYKYQIASVGFTSYHWFVRRGCAEKVPDAPLVFGLQQQSNLCTKKSGTLCNSNFGQYSIDDEVKMQVLKPIECFVCKTKINNTDAQDACYIKQEKQHLSVCEIR